jgi:hypothetical protein
MLAISLRAFLLLVLVAAGGMAWWANLARRQGKAVAAIVGSGGWVAYDWQQADESGSPRDGPPGPAWLRRMLGDHGFQAVVEVALYKQGDAAECPPRLAEALDRLEALPGLRTLGLYRLREADPALARLRRLGRLEHLAIHADRLGDAGLAHLGSLRRLRSLDITVSEPDQTLTAAGAGSVGRLADLETLVLRRLAVTDEALARLAGLSKLRMLSISHPRITDEGLRLLAALSGLEVLALPGSTVTDSGLAHVRGLARLKELRLRAWPGELGDDGLVHLKGLARLEVLALRGSRVSDRGLGHLRGLTRLRDLDLGGGAVTQEGMDAFREAMPSLLIGRWYVMSLGPSEEPPMPPDAGRGSQTDDMTAKDAEEAGTTRGEQR